MDKKALQLADFPVVYPLQTRWQDNDVYGHVNNVVYYSYFDTAINKYLIEKGGLDIANSQQIGLMVHSECDFFSSLAYPDEIDVGLAVSKIGNSSVNYLLGVFKEGVHEASAIGRMTHVFVDRQSNKSMPITGDLRKALNDLIIN